MCGVPKARNALQEVCLSRDRDVLSYAGAHFQIIFLFLSLNYVRDQWTRPCPLDAAASNGHGRVHWTRPRQLDTVASAGHDRHPEHTPSSYHPQGGPIGKVIMEPLLYFVSNCLFETCVKIAQGIF